MINRSVSELVQILSQSFKKQDRQSFEPYIREIRFPNYKMVEKNEKISFDFPLTFLVGGNGTNKTSVLQAIYGCPKGKNIGEYWFNTNVDKIEGNVSDGPSCYIYKYKHLGASKEVEAIITRVNKKSQTVDYWETARPASQYGMEIPTKKEFIETPKQNSETRWDLIEKNVVYSDCKEYLSAFDLFFYHSNFERTNNIKTRQDFLRHRSKYLSMAIFKDMTELKYYNKPQIESNEKLTKEVCKKVSEIMGENYSEIKIVTHSLYTKGGFGKPSKTIWMKKNNLTYSEAFAGSGESRLILLVNDIIKAEKNSLILIDEPEISLHPNAIERLKKFFLGEVITKKHQMVVSTHSSALIRGLPKEAIKLLCANVEKKVDIQENITYQEAFYEIGQFIETAKTIYVEDILAKYLVERVLNNLFKDRWKDLISVKFLPGGAEAIITRSVSQSSLENEKHVYYLLDGDQNHYPYVTSKFINNEWCDKEIEKIKVKKIPESENKNLGDILKAVTNCEIKLSVSGSKGKSNTNEKILKQRQFLTFWEKNVFFLPNKTPEAFLIEFLEGGGQKPEGNSKEYFKKVVMEELLENPTSDDILNYQRRVLAKIKKETLGLETLNLVLEKIMS